ncbi:hypothetical protein CEXT_281181 [Caerostris extrusa]|uniref:Uncharacterized protein n=1 Tax=Caerostris extrusa TaxID=172846 RepID=A0AAV4Y3M0_CAEEX|nr:hypothetical protein CEXT_281181 [Caerostris extrusa]
MSGSLLQEAPSISSLPLSILGNAHLLIYWLVMNGLPEYLAFNSTLSTVFSLQSYPEAYFKSSMSKLLTTVYHDLFLQAKLSDS